MYLCNYKRYSDNNEKKNNKKTLCSLCGTLCYKKNYTELYGEGTENHREISGLLRSAHNEIKRSLFFLFFFFSFYSFAQQNTPEFKIPISTTFILPKFLK
jgi:hypothetical protein